MTSEATPRINAKYLDSFTNQTVRILGKVVSLRGETATVDANGTINVHLNRVCVAVRGGQETLANGTAGCPSKSEQCSRDRGEGAAGFKREGVSGYGFWE
jgi:hypothetical protein